MNIGDRVRTSHGIGIVDSVETCPNWKDERKPTGRYGIRFANSPFPWPAPVGYFWPDEVTVLPYEMGHTVANTNGQPRGSLTYYPNKDAELPWVSYRDGKEGQHYSNLREGIRQMQVEGYRFPILVAM